MTSDPLTTPLHILDRIFHHLSFLCVAGHVRAIDLLHIAILYTTLAVYSGRVSRSRRNPESPDSATGAGNDEEMLDLLRRCDFCSLLGRAVSVLLFSDL